MKRNLIFVGIVFAILLAGASLAAKDKGGVISGTWECQAQGGSQGDIAFTLYLQQDKESVDGSVSSPVGGTQISSGSFKRNMLEIHLDTPQGSYVLMGKYNKGLLSGVWTTDNDKGTWDGKKHVATAK